MTPQRKAFADLVLLSQALRICERLDAAEARATVKQLDAIKRYTAAKLWWIRERGKRK